MRAEATPDYDYHNFFDNHYHDHHNDHDYDHDNHNHSLHACPSGKTRHNPQR